jgi:hypothetical protein
VAYLGVGPVPVELQEQVAATRGVPAFEVKNVPTSGRFLRPDATPINAGHLLSEHDIAGLSYLPRIDSRSVGIEERLQIEPRGEGSDIEPIEIAVSSEIHPCDLLAGFRYAPDRVWDGVELPILRLDPQPAIEACEQAVAEYPEIDRFIAILGRAYEAHGDYPRVREMALKAIARDYPPGALHNWARST